MAKSRAAAPGPDHCAATCERAQAAFLDPWLARMAWEFLRRNQAYQADYARVASGETDKLPDHWGLAGPIDPAGSDVDVGRIWREDRPARANLPAAAFSAGSPRASARR